MGQWNSITFPWPLHYQDEKFMTKPIFLGVIYPGYTLYMHLMKSHAFYKPLKHFTDLCHFLQNFLTFPSLEIKFHVFIICQVTETLYMFSERTFTDSPLASHHKLSARSYVNTPCYIHKFRIIFFFLNSCVTHLIVLQH